MIRRLSILAVILLGAASAARGQVQFQSGQSSVLYPDNYSSSADICTRINTAALKLTASGGTVDDSARSGTVSCTTNPYAGLATGVNIKLGAAIYQTTAAWVVPGNSTLEGKGSIGGTGTIVQAVAGFPSTTAVISLCTSSCSAAQVVHVQVDCNAQTGCIGMQNKFGQEDSFFQHVNVQNFPNLGYDIETANAQNSGPYQDLTAAPNASGVAGTIPLKILNVTIKGMQSVSVGGNSGAVSTNCISLDQSNILMLDVSVQNCTNGVTLDPNNSQQFEGITHLSCGTGCTNGVVFGAQSFGSYDLRGIWNANSANPAVIDTVHYNNTLNFYVSQYTISEYGGGLGTLICSARAPCANSSVGTPVALASNFTTASTSLVTAGTFTWSLPAVAHNYSFFCNLSYSQATAAAANAFGVQAATTAPTNLYAAMNVGTGLAISGVDATLPTLTTTTATNIGTFTPSAAGAIGTIADIFTAQIWGRLEQGAGATTFNIMVLTGSASDSITIYRGSTCTLYP